MLRIMLFFTVISLQSCFLFGKFRKQQLSFSDQDAPASYQVLLPKGFTSAHKRIDTTGNEEVYYHYADGSQLYFVRVKDSSVAYQPINYALNLPRSLYHSIYFKGIDSLGRYWRETRFLNYKLGYRSVEPGEDWKFDSALNYFSLRAVVQ